MRNNIKTQAHGNVTLTVEKIQEIVRIDSVRDVENAQPGAPFGPGIRQSLESFLQMAEEIGMRTYIDPEGYYGYAEIGDIDSPEMIGILGHIDVVPVGDLAQWTEALPFSGDIVDDAIIGRGSLDDKGPMVINLIAVKTLIDLGVVFKKRVRFIVGTAEETTWECVDAYFAKEEAPTFGYTPDANFPVVNAEKSILQFDVINNSSSADFTLKADGAYNAVSDRVTYTGGKVQEIIEQLDLVGAQYQKNSDNELVIMGKSAHAMACFLGDNAIFKAAVAMHAVGERSKLIDLIVNKLAGTFYGEKIVGKVEDKVSGKLTLNVGWIDINSENESMGMDSRIPVLVEEEKVEEAYKQEIEKLGLEYKLLKLEPKIYSPEDGDLVSTLLGVYKEITDDVEAKPQSTGGGTYARAGKNLVAFGTVFESQGMCDRMHQPNEKFEVKFIPLALEIYATAIYDLLQK